MRTPVILVAGQAGTNPVVGALLRTPGTLVVEHRFDGHVVRRTTAMRAFGALRGPRSARKSPSGRRFGVGVNLLCPLGFGRP